MEENIVLLALAGFPVVAGYALLVFFRRRIHTRNPRWVFVAAGNLLVFTLMAACLLLAGELYFRFFRDTTDSFALTKTSRRWFQRHYIVNNSGFRDSLDIYPLQRTSGQRRITFLGDSFTAGHGIADVELRFANLIRAEHPEWEVHVMAECGWDTGAEMAALTDPQTNGYLLDVVDYELDRVVLVYCLNDIADIVPQHAVLSNEEREFSPAWKFVEHSYCLNTLYWRLHVAFDERVSGYYDHLQEAYQDAELWAQQAKRLETLAKSIDARGGKLLVVTFPFLHSIDSTYPFRAAHARLDRHWSELGVPHLDLLDLFASRESSDLIVNAYDAHPNERAHALAARAISEFVRTHLD